MAIINLSADILLSNLHFSNTLTGFNLMVHTIQKLQRTSNEPVFIGLEASGHYTFALLNFLKQMPFNVSTYNPIIIKEFSKSISLRKTKTDKRDALIIAHKLLLDKPLNQLSVDDGIIQELKFMTRHQQRFTKERAMLKIQYIKLLDMLFPELADTIGKQSLS